MSQQAGASGANPRNQNNHANNLRRKFGDIGNFWGRYDELADDHDHSLIKNLNDNLDVLLIFAGLFSAVNTSFIQMATPNLSPDPTAETNYLLRVLITKLDNTTFSTTLEPPSQSKDPTSVRTNCALYASLCCSILAAVGAMLAKEWLQSFERSGQVGPLRDQVLLRQRKFNGVRQWQLEPMIRLLPTVLLISVVLFFWGLIEYLFPVDDSAGAVVLAFGILGSIFYLLTTIAAAIWDACPYQTSVSKATKYVAQAVVMPSTKRLSLWLMRRFGLNDLLSGLNALTEPLRGEKDTEVLSAQAACWLLETTSSPDDQQMAIQNLISLSPGVCSFLIHDWDTYQRMLALTLHVIRNWQDQPNNHQTGTTAQQFCAALLHLCVGYPRQSTKWSMVKESLSSQIAGDHLQGTRLSGCLELCLSDSTNAFPASPAAIFPSNDYSMKVVTLSMIALGDVPFWSLDRAHAWAALWHVFGDKYDDTILALVALAISKGFLSANLQQPDDMRVLVQSACSGKDIVSILLEGVRCGPIALTNPKDYEPSYIHALPIFIEILQRLGELPATKALAGVQPDDLLPDVARLILAVDGIYEAARSSGASSAVDELMTAALRLLRICNPPVKQFDFTPLLFHGTLVAFIRCNHSSPSISALEMQTLDWLNLCLSESDIVAGRTISSIMWGLGAIESREEVLQLTYTYMSTWVSGIDENRYKKWISKGLIVQLLDALLEGTTTGSMNLMAPLTLRHIVKRATTASWELEESEKIIRTGVEVVNSVKKDTGTVGLAYSLLIFEVLLSVWETIPEERREKQMSEGMVRATMRILMETDELLGDRPRNTTLTSALRSKIGIMVCSEPFDLPPATLQKFVSELMKKKADICSSIGLDTVVGRVQGRLFDGSTHGK